MVDTKDRAEAERAIANALRVPAKWRAPLAAELVGIFEEAAPKRPPPGKRSLGIIVGRWVIRDDDLALLDWVAPVVISIAAATAAKAPTYTTGAVLGTIAAVVRFTRNLLRKGATLGEREVKVLSAVKASDGGATVEELFLRLRDDGVETVAQVEEALARLREVKTRTGLMALVSQDSEGLWVPNGV